MRPARPGDGLRPRSHPFPRGQARGQGQGAGSVGQNHHDPLHPLHPLCPLRPGDRRHRGAGRDRPRRAYGDRHLYRESAHLRALGQHHRHLPCRRPDLEALRVQRPLVGAGQDRDRRCDGRPRLQHPGRFPEPRGDARPPPAQRGYQRGMDRGQDPLRVRRPAPPAPRYPHGATGRPPRACELGGCVLHHRREGEGRCGREDGCDRRRSRRCRGAVRVEGPDGPLGVSKSRLPTGRRVDRSERSCELFIQHDHRRNRRRGCDPPGRHQSSLGGAAGQCTDSQALARKHGRPCRRRDRAAGRVDLRHRLSWRRTPDPGGYRRRFPRLCADADGCRTRDDRGRAGRACPDRRRRRSGGGPGYCRNLRHGRQRVERL